MSEIKNNTLETGEGFTTPSQIRVRQLLGQVSLGPVYEENLFPKIINLSETETTPEELVLTLEENLREFADKHLLGTRIVAYKNMPRLISVLTWGQDKPREDALGFWDEFVGEQIKSTENGDHGKKLPRKARKALKKPAERRSARERARLAKMLERRQEDIN